MHGERDEMGVYASRETKLLRVCTGENKQ